MSEFAGYAYPMGEGGAHTTRGLTKRELFAAMAMQGILASAEGRHMSTDEIAESALAHGDALLEALK